MTDQTNSSTRPGGRERAVDAYSNARGNVTETLSEAPLLALAGGLAAGALIAALLPRTQSETRALRPTARRVKDSAQAAFEAARDTGSRRLDELGLNRDKAADTVRSLFQGVSDAAKASAEAGVEAVRNKS